jgi:hypothetical protein
MPRAVPLVVLVRHHDLGLEQIVGNHLLTLAARSALTRLIAAGATRFIGQASLTGSAFDDDEAVGLQDHHAEQRGRRPQAGSVVAIPRGGRVFLDAQDTKRLVAVFQPVAGTSAGVAGLAKGRRRGGQASRESQNPGDRVSAEYAGTNAAPVRRGCVLHHVRSPGERFMNRKRSLTIGHGDVATEAANPQLA